MSNNNVVKTVDGKPYVVQSDGTLKPQPTHTGGAIGAAVDAGTNIVKTLVDSVTPTTKSSTKK